MKAYMLAESYTLALPASYYSVDQAADQRKRRVGCAVQGDGNVLSRIKPSDLCIEGRRNIQRWAMGHISGHQCFLRFRFCESFLHHLEMFPDTQEPEAVGPCIPFWAAGCVRLGGSEQRLKQLQKDIEEKTPSQVLEEAVQAIKEEVGEAGSNKPEDQIDWNYGLRRLAKRAWCGAGGGEADPVAFLRAEVWREVIRCRWGATDAADSEEDFAWLDDRSLLQWMNRTPEEVREAVLATPQAKLRHEISQLLEHLRCMHLSERALREGIDGWTRYGAYRVLGIKRGATRGQVKRAFRKKALKMHPDKGGDKVAFQELQEAYEEAMAALDAKAAERGGYESPEEAEKEEEEEDEITKNARKGFDAQTEQQNWSEQNNPASKKPEEPEPEQKPDADCKDGAQKESTNAAGGVPPTPMETDQSTDEGNTAGPASKAQGEVPGPFFQSHRPSSTPQDSEERARAAAAAAEARAKAAEARNAQEALNTLLEVTAKLRTENTQLLELQAKARKITEKVAKCFPKELAEMKEKVFVFLAELLDEAASVEFFTAMETGLKALESKTLSNCKKLMVQSLNESFSFLLLSTSKVSIPIDPREQILRAAMAFDAKAVRDMVLVQTMARIRVSLRTLSETKGAAWGAGILAGVGVLASIQTMLHKAMTDIMPPKA